MPDLWACQETCDYIALNYEAAKRVSTKFCRGGDTLSTMRAQDLLK